MQDKNLNVLIYTGRSNLKSIGKRAHNWKEIEEYVEEVKKIENDNENYNFTNKI